MSALRGFFGDRLYIIVEVKEREREREREGYKGVGRRGEMRNT